MLLSLWLFGDQFQHIVAVSFTALILNELLMVAYEIHTWSALTLLTRPCCAAHWPPCKLAGTSLWCTRRCLRSPSTSSRWSFSTRTLVRRHARLCPAGALLTMQTRRPALYWHVGVCGKGSAAAAGELRAPLCLSLPRAPLQPPELRQAALSKVDTIKAYRIRYYINL